MDLPMDQLWFNILLRILITVYSANGIWSFFAYIPWMSKDDARILWYWKNSSYSFQLISSLIFCLLWIAEFKYDIFTYLTIWEIVILIASYLHLIESKLIYLKGKKIKIKKINKRRNDEIMTKLS